MVSDFFLPALLCCALAMSSPASQSSHPDLHSLWNYQKPAETEQRFLALKAQLDLTQDAAFYLELLTQVARSQGLQARFDEAHQTLDRVEQAQTGKTPLVQVRYLLERGRVLNSSGQKERSLPLFTQALELAQAQQLDFHAVDAAHMLGIVTPPAEQIRWTEMALTLAEASADERAQGWLGSLYNNLAWSWHEQGEYTKALALFEKNLSWHEARLKPGQSPGQGLLIARWSVGRALRSLARYPEALALQQALLASYATQNLPEDGYVHEELGENLLALKRQAEARPHFAKAWDLLSTDTWLQQHEAERLQRLQTLGESK